MSMEGLLARLGEIPWGVFLGGLFRVVVVVLVAWVAIKVIKAGVRRWLTKIEPDTDENLEWYQRVKTVTSVIVNLGSVAVVIIAAMVVLSMMGVDVAPLLAGAGIIGIALGLGAQHLVRDFLSGIFVLMENQFAVGDVIKTAGVAGGVESISMRRTVLRDVEGNMHIIPNGKIDMVTNMTRDWSRALLDVGVAYKEDTDRVVDLLRQIGDELFSDEEYGAKLLAPMEIPGVQGLDDSSVNIRCYFNTRPGKHWEVMREMRRRIKKAFDQEGIEIPFPHRTLYLGEWEKSMPISIDPSSGAGRFKDDVKKAGDSSMSGSNGSTITE